MTSFDAAERKFFTDLTRMLMSMRDAPFGDVEARIEDRLRDFVRSQPKPDVGGLQITFTWSLPEGADDWAIYRTDYQTLPVEPAAQPRVAAGGGGSAVLAFPARQADRPAAAAPYPAAEVVAFPSR